MTYDQLAEARHISRRAAVRMTQRQRLRRQPSNDGHVLVWVPRDMLSPSQRTSRSDDGGDDASAVARDGNGLLAALAALPEQQEHERVALKGQIDALRTAIDAKNGELAAYHGVVDGFEKRVVALETERDRALSDLQVAQLAQTEAEAAAAELRQADDARKARGGCAAPGMAGGGGSMTAAGDPRRAVRRDAWRPSAAWLLEAAQGGMAEGVAGLLGLPVP
jgi:hypothetical protein